ncbi:MAG: hypothetical protein Q9M13_05025 [Mariprofundales bacterium]|nr:hypothetical protein [Mariprofundales bacterium]
MKLTLALGLQYSNNRDASVYALSIGGERTINRADQIEAVVADDPPPLSTPPWQRASWSTLSYNLSGRPVMLPPDATVDIFA